MIVDVAKNNDVIIKNVIKDLENGESIKCITPLWINC